MKIKNKYQMTYKMASDAYSSSFSRVRHDVNIAVLRKQLTSDATVAVR